MFLNKIKNIFTYILCLIITLEPTVNYASVPSYVKISADILGKILTINAAQNINADYKESDNLPESLDRLANQPEFKYLKDLQTKDIVD